VDHPRGRRWGGHKKQRFHKTSVWNVGRAESGGLVQTKPFRNEPKLHFLKKWWIFGCRDCRATPRVRKKNNLASLKARQNTWVEPFQTISLLEGWARRGFFRKGEHVQHRKTAALPLLARVKKIVILRKPSFPRGGGGAWRSARARGRPSAIFPAARRPEKNSFRKGQTAPRAGGQLLVGLLEKKNVAEPRGRARPCPMGPPPPDQFAGQAKQGEKLPSRQPFSTPPSHRQVQIKKKKTRKPPGKSVFKGTVGAGPISPGSKKKHENPTNRQTSGPGRFCAKAVRFTA